MQILEKYYPTRYRENLGSDEFKVLCDSLVEKWSFLKGKSIVDCVRIYLTCTRKWPFFATTLFSVTVSAMTKDFKLVSIIVNARCLMRVYTCAF